MRRDFIPWYRDVSFYAAFSGSFVTLMAGHRIFGWEVGLPLFVVGLAMAVVSGLAWKMSPLPNAIGAND